MTIWQGDIYHVDLEDPTGSEPGYEHYIVIVQSNPLNRSNVRTTVACVLTTNLNRGNVPGNVTLNPGEGQLPEQSVVNISQVVTVDKRNLGNKVGVLDNERMDEVIESMYLVLLKGQAP